MLTPSVGNSFLEAVSLLAGARRLHASNRVAATSTARPTTAADAARSAEAVSLAPSDVADTVTISPGARRAAASLSAVSPQEGSSEPSSGGRPSAAAGASRSGAESTGTDASSESERQIAELRRTDREVRAHENAHLAAGGSVTRGGPTFTFRTGPDGKRYAVAGEVSIQVTSGSDDPEDRIQHAQQVRRAALAPADPSSADRAIAARAAQEIAAARAELRAGESENASAPAGAARDAGPFSDSIVSASAHERSALEDEGPRGGTTARLEHAASEAPRSGGLPRGSVVDVFA